MKFFIDKHEKYTLIRLENNKLISEIAPQLKSELIQINATGVCNLILDLKNVQLADSSGLSALLTGNRLFKSSGGLFVICGLSPHVKKLIEISKLDGTLIILPTVSEAVDMVFLDQLEKGLLGEEK